MSEGGREGGEKGEGGKVHVHVGDRGGSTVCKKYIGYQSYQIRL